MLYQTVAETCSTVQMRIVFPKGVREVGVRLGMMGVYLAYGLGGLDTDGMVGAICGVYGAAAIVNICYLIFSSNRNGRSASGGATETKRNAAGMFRPDFGFLRANRRLTVEAVHYMAFVTLSALVSVLAPYLSSFIISARQGLDWNGIFKMAFFMSAMVSIPSRSLTGIASPELSAAMSRGDQHHTARLTQQVARNLWIAGWLITAAIWLNIDLIFHILPNGSVYEAGREAVLLLSLSQLLLSTFSITLVTLTYSRHYRLTLVFSLLLTLLTHIPSTGLNSYLLVIRMGEEAERQANQLVNGLKVQQLKSKTVSSGGIEATYEVRVDKPDALLNKLRGVPGVYDATLVSYSGEAV